MRILGIAIRHRRLLRNVIDLRDPIEEVFCEMKNGVMMVWSRYMYMYPDEVYSAFIIHTKPSWGIYLYPDWTPNTQVPREPQLEGDFLQKYR